MNDINLKDIDLESPGDIAYSENVNTAKPNFGAGIYYSNDKFYIAASVPNILETEHYDSNGVKFGSENRHYFLTTGYDFQLSEDFKYKPSFLIKSAFESQASFDINSNFVLYDKLELGISYRLEDSFSTLINFAISPNFRIGYAYDAVTSDIRHYAAYSHEVFLLFDLKWTRHNNIN